MKKFIGVTWIEWVCIFVAVVTAELLQEATPTNGVMHFITYFIGWFIGYTLCFLLIKAILKWTGKN